MSASDLIAAHRKSLGRAGQQPSAMRDFSGKAEMQVVVGGSGVVRGEAFLLSQGNKIKFTTKFNNADYSGDQVVFDGKQVQVGFLKAGTRSALGDFLNFQQVLVREGLFGGSLTSAWAMRDLEARNAKVNYDGLKKVDGRELHQVTYVPKRADRLAIKLYFAADTFQHVRSQYVITIPPPATGNVLDSPSLTDARFTLTETFDGFRDVDNINVPSKWVVTYEAETDRFPSSFSQESSSNRAVSGGRAWKWTMTFDDFRVTPARQ